MRRLALTLLASLHLAALAFGAGDFEARVKSFQLNATSALAQTDLRNAGQSKLESGFRSISRLSSFNLKSTKRNLDEFDQMVEAIALLAPSDAKLAKEAVALIAAAKTERQSLIDRERDEIDALIKKVGDACLAAEDPADIDSALAALTRRQRLLPADREALDEKTGGRVENALSFVKTWQDYLSRRKVSGPDAGRNLLEPLANSPSFDVALMSRSALLARIHPQPAVNATSAGAAAPAVRMETARTFEEFATVLHALPRDASSAQGTLRATLAVLLDERQQVLAGYRPHSLFSNETIRRLSPEGPDYSPERQAALLAFHRDTQLAWARAALRLAKLPPATDGETVETYLLRLAGGFASADEWQHVRATLEVYRAIPQSGRQPSWLDADIESIGAYLGGLNLEQGGLHSAAVSSYQRALRQPGQFTPTEKIGARLADLKKRHPDAFSDGAASPPPQNRPRNMP